MSGKQEPLKEDAPPWTADVVRTDPMGSLQVVATDLAGPLSLERIGAGVAAAATTALDAEMVLVGVCEGVGRHVRVLHASGLSPAALRRLPAALAAASSVLRMNRQAAARSLDAIAESLAGPGGGDDTPAGRHALAAVMPPSERALGIILVSRTRGGRFSRRDRTFVDALAAVAALALERLDLAEDARRLGPQSAREPIELRVTGSNLHLGDMEIDLGDQEVTVGDRRARLTPSEIRILLFLSAEPGRARTRREILRHLWHTDYVGDERACDAHISNLRRKIERDPTRPQRVVTCRGVGYTLRLTRDGG